MPGSRKFAQDNMEMGINWNLMKSMLLFLLLAGLAACNGGATGAHSLPATDTMMASVRQDSPVHVPEPAAAAPEEDTAALALAMDAVAALPEVQQWGIFLEQQTQGERHMKFWAWGAPKPDAPYYWIKVGEDNGMSLVAQFNFFVYPESGRIMYYDVVEGEPITLEAWRAKEKAADTSKTE
jgi:hypothetical protein